MTSMTQNNTNPSNLTPPNLTPRKGRVAPNVAGLSTKEKQALFDAAVAKLGKSSGAAIEKATGLGHGFVQRALTKLRGTPQKVKRATPKTPKTAKATQATPAAQTTPNVQTVTGAALLTPATTPAAAPSTVRRTHVAYVLDASGSMRGITHQAENICDEQLRAVKEQLAAEDKLPNTPGRVVNDYTATAIMFGNPHNASVIVEYAGEDPRRLQRAFRNYAASSGTPLFDAVGEAIEQLKAIKKPNYGEDAYLVLIITDGEENSSMRYNAQRLTKLINECNADGNWTISFMVPRGGERALRRFGIDEGNIRVWEATHEGAALAAQSVYASTQSYTQSRTKGITRTANFFVDAAKLDIADVRKRLQDVTSQYRRIHVSKEDTITNVVNHAGEVFKKGNTYYELTKDELVQADKDLLIQKRLEKTIYGGTADDVRAMLGIAVGQKVRVKIANLGEWRVYVKSNSDNRILVRGSDILWRK